jgi:hypothetical protein
MTRTRPQMARTDRSRAPRMPKGRIGPGGKQMKTEGPELRLGIGLPLADSPERFHQRSLEPRLSA